MLVNQDGLHLLKKVLRFVEVQTERVDRQRVTVDLGHVMRD